VPKTIWAGAGTSAMTVTSIASRELGFPGRHAGEQGFDEVPMAGSAKKKGSRSVGRDRTARALRHDQAATVAVDHQVARPKDDLFARRDDAAGALGLDSFEKRRPAAEVAPAHVHCA